MLEEVNQQTGDLHTRLNAANNKVNDLIETSMCKCSLLPRCLAFIISLLFCRSFQVKMHDYVVLGGHICGSYIPCVLHIAGSYFTSNVQFNEHS